MRTTLCRLGLILPFLVSSLLSAQTAKRFESGPYKGFTLSPTEHILDEVPEPLNVRSIRGVIHEIDLTRPPLPDVIIEIRDASGNVRGTLTNERGEFRMPNLPVGIYDFKFTKNGFQSIVGKIELSKAAPRKSRIILGMKLGV